MRKLFAILLLLSLPATADELAFHTLQSGVDGGPTPLTDRGLDGSGQLIAVLDTGADWDSCYLAEPDGAVPPINTGTPAGGLDSSNVDLGRRKVVAYDFLYSCDQYPGAAGCDDPASPLAFDNAYHGTIAAIVAAGDSRAPRVHDDDADSLATGAKLIIQDGGFIGGDDCGQRPGFGCPVALTPILEQAWRQGARIQSNSWGDRQGYPPPVPPPTANYSAAARDIDAFVWSHPDMLVVFNTGNSSTTGLPPVSSLSAPGCAKNTLQVGGTRAPQIVSDDVLSWFSLVGPTRDGRIKPDLAGPAVVTTGESDGNIATRNCDTATEPGTSWSAPSIAGAAALVRQYFTAGFYPSGASVRKNAFAPSAALMKATLIAAARRVPNGGTDGSASTHAVPWYDQGFGFPVLDDALYFPGDASKLRVSDVANPQGLAAGETKSTQVVVGGGAPLKVVLVWTDPPGTARTWTDPTPVLVNDLDLRVTTPTGTLLYGNEELHPHQPDRLNNVEAISIPLPAAGTYTVSVSAERLGLGPRQGYALVVTGDLAEPVPPFVAAGRARSSRH